MASPPKRRLENPAIFVCDLQEKFASAIWEFDKVVLTTQKLLRFARALHIPVYTTTQNAARLGPVVPEIKTLLDDIASIPDGRMSLLKFGEDKTKFSMFTPLLKELLPGPNSNAADTNTTGMPQIHSITNPPPPARAHIALVGIESHICITQTALDALEMGHRVYVLADGVSSCNRLEVGVALERLRAAGAVVTTSESWVYEVMGDAGVEEFRGVVGVVKESARDTRVALEGLRGKI